MSGEPGHLRSAVERLMEAQREALEVTLHRRLQHQVRLPDPPPLDKLARDRRVAERLWTEHNNWLVQLGGSRGLRGRCRRRAG